MLCYRQILRALCCVIRYNFPPEFRGMRRVRDRTNAPDLVLNTLSSHAQIAQVTVVLVVVNLNYGDSYGPAC